MPKVWLVTGSGNGLGRDIVEAALAGGDAVVAGARRPEELDSLVQRFGERIRTVALEVRDPAAAQHAVDTAVAAFGRLDVLVNNAGYGHIAPFEQMSPTDFQAVVDTCFYGVVYTTRAALPVMRRQGSGYIFQVSSIGGRFTIPGNSPYHAAKFAVGGFSDSIATELAPLGIQVCTLEPGGIRTNWATRAQRESPDILPEYRPTVGTVIDYMRSLPGKAEGDPRRIASLLVDLASRAGLPRRLVLGVNAEERVQRNEADRAEEAKRYSNLTHSTVFPGEGMQVPHNLGSR